ncbi:Conserved hypothetical protein [gamma proteobacterium HdN1]|nr:Conserved hypothetical protein [gamma proteobacterium HdN1]
MLYRLETTHMRLPAETHFSPQRPIPFKMDRSPSTIEYHAYFEEVTPNGYAHCKLYKAPILPMWRMDVPLKVTLCDYDMIDILVLNNQIYASDVVKNIIETHDPFGHQFWPVDVVDESGTPVSTTQFYHMNMRRYVTIEDLGKPLLDADYRVNKDIEGKYVSSIQHDVLVRDFVESLPIWRHFFPRYTIDIPLFINEPMFKALQAGGVTGIKEFTQFDGQLGEMVAHV